MLFEYLDTSVFGILTVNQILVIIHLVGVALGVGAAFYSDFLFTNILKDKEIDKVEFRILELTSNVVWIGLLVLLLSGIGIYLGDIVNYVQSTKFLAKMSIILILFVNGLNFHFRQIPYLKKHLHRRLDEDYDFMKHHATPFFMSGALSGVSWLFALALGSLDSVDAGYFQIMGVYLAVVALAMPGAVFVRRHLL